MDKPTTRWGVMFFCASAAMQIFAIYAVITFPPPRFRHLYVEIVPLLGIVFSLVSFLAGHFSYPRVHNLKVYLAGYLTGLAGLAYFGLYSSLPRGAAQPAALMCLVFINMLLIVVLPSIVKYRVTHRVTVSLTALEAVYLVAARFSPCLSDWVRLLVPDDLIQPQAWIGIVWAAIVLLLTVWRLRAEFHLGGILAGTAVFYCLAWIAPAFMYYSAALQSMLFAMATLFLNTGIVIHWFLRIEHRVSHDPLLHIYNRNYCSRIIAEQSNCNTLPPFAVAMVDIDHFKQVNDTHGHQAGDAVLYQVAQAIVREVVPHGVACRYGGEEIVVFFAQKTAKDIAPIMENVRAAIEGLKIPIGKKSLRVTVSCGISYREDAAQSVIDVIHAADKALYKAKKDGRNRVKSARTPLPAAKKK